MNRLKLWALALLVLVAGAVNLVLTSQWLAHEAVGDADRTLRAAAAELDARSRLLALQAGALAEAAARAPAVLAALADDAEGDPTAAAAVAVAAAGRGTGTDGARSLLVGTSGLDGTSLRLSGKPVELQDPAAGFFAEPLRGQRWEGYARAADLVWFVVAVPAGKGAAAVGLPVDGAWAQALRDAAGAEVVLAAGQAQPISTLAGGDFSVVAAVARSAMPQPVDAGQLGRVPAALPGAPALPLLSGRLPALRVQVVALKGMKAGLAVLAVPLARRAAGLATYQAVSVAVLALLLLAGLFLGLLVTPDLPPSVPRELVAAADRIGRGDFSARVQRLAGSLGTVGAALNRAAEAAEAARNQAPAFDPPAIPPGLFGNESVPHEDPFALPSRPPPAPLDAPRPPAEATGLDLFAPPPPAPLPPLTPPRFAPLGDTVSGATSLTTRPEELARPAPEAPIPTPMATPMSIAAAATPPPLPGAAGDPEVAHWREVFQEFLRVREACGEPNEGLAFDRFEAKLRSNRAALVEKHACRTVRFQVYVKDGRAALKATPVR